MLETWDVFTVRMQRNLEETVQDQTLPDCLPCELPKSDLYDVGSYFYHDIAQTLFRFVQQLGKYDGCLKYLNNGTKDPVRPRTFVHHIETLKNDLRRRMGILMEGGDMNLNLINNYIAMQQTRLASQHALISAYMAQVQRRDSRSARRLFIIATIFLPLSFATSWLGTNGTTSLRMFVPIALASIAVTMALVLFLVWVKRQDLHANDWSAQALRRFVTIPGPVEVRTRDLLRMLDQST